jgi:protoheme IX farnesyltransferase
LRLILDLFKVRIGLAIAAAALVGLVVTPGGRVPAGQVAALMFAQLLAAAAAGAFNQFAERDLDARMKRTRRRAFVTGRLEPGAAWLSAILVVGAAGVGLAGTALNPLVAIYTFLGAFTYAVVYTLWLKRRTPWNIVVGGLAGSFAVLAGAAAVAPHPPSWLTLLFAAVLFLWTPPHFWSLAIAFHEDYAAAKVPMLPVVAGVERAARAVFAGAALLVAVALLPVCFGMGWLYGLTASAAGAYLLTSSARLARRPGRAAAMANFRASLVYLALIVVAAIADRLLRS